MGRAPPPSSGAGRSAAAPAERPRGGCLPTESRARPGVPPAVPRHAASQVRRHAPADARPRRNSARSGAHGHPAGRSSPSSSDAPARRLPAAPGNEASRCADPAGVGMAPRPGFQAPGMGMPGAPPAGLPRPPMGAMPPPPRGCRGPPVRRSRVFPDPQAPRCPCPARPGTRPFGLGAPAPQPMQAPGRMAPLPPPRA